MEPKQKTKSRVIKVSEGFWRKIKREADRAECTMEAAINSMIENGKGEHKQ